MVAYFEQSTVILQDNSHKFLKNIFHHTIDGIKTGLKLESLHHQIHEIDLNDLDLEPRYDNLLWEKIFTANNIVIVGYENQSKKLSHCLKKFLSIQVKLNFPSVAIFLYTTEPCHNLSCDCYDCLSCNCVDPIQYWAKRNNVNVKSETRWKYSCNESDQKLDFYKDMSTIISEFVCS